MASPTPTNSVATKGNTTVNATKVGTTNFFSFLANSKKNPQLQKERYIQHGRINGQELYGYASLAKFIFNTNVEDIPRVDYVLKVLTINDFDIARVNYVQVSGLSCL